MYTTRTDLGIYISMISMKYTKLSLIRVSVSLAFEFLLFLSILRPSFSYLMNLQEMIDISFDFRTDTTPYVYLHHHSEMGEFWLSSDAVIPTYTREYKIRNIIDLIPSNELDQFNTIGYTIGGMMLFPGHRVGQKMTINGARGFHPRIKDRFDLTVECILRHYRGEWSPLQDTLLG